MCSTVQNLWVLLWAHWTQESRWLWNILLAHLDFGIYFASTLGIGKAKETSKLTYLQGFACMADTRLLDSRVPASGDNGCHKLNNTQKYILAPTRNSPDLAHIDSRRMDP